MDQFLMQGGTVIIATSPYSFGLEGALTITPYSSGLNDWLAHYGISMEEKMVLDPQNSAFPVPVERDVGGFTIHETHMVKYPYFVDIRPDGMNLDSGLMSGLNQLTMNWSSPIDIDEEKNNKRTVTRLLESSENSWLSSSTDVQPDFRQHGDLGFPVTDKQDRQLLAVALEGNFSSYFTGKPSPLLTQEKPAAPKPSAENQQEEKEERQVITRQIDKSPASARIILFASNSFLTDTIINISSSVMRTTYLNPIQMIANTIDWSLEDRGLLSIRGRSHFSRSLIPMTKDMQLFWEYLNYGLILIGLAVIWLLKSIFQKRTKKQELALLQQPSGRI